MRFLVDVYTWVVFFGSVEVRFRRLGRVTGIRGSGFGVLAFSFSKGARFIFRRRGVG